MNNNHDQLLGYIKGKVEAIEKKMDSICNKVERNDKRLDEHDRTLGKFGAYAAGLAFLIGVTVNFIMDWVRDKFIN